MAEKVGSHGHQRHVGAPEFVQIKWLGDIVYSPPLVLPIRVRVEVKVHRKQHRYPDDPAGEENKMMSVTRIITDLLPFSSNVFIFHCLEDVLLRFSFFRNPSKVLINIFLSFAPCTRIKIRLIFIKCIVVFITMSFISFSLYL